MRVPKYGLTDEQVYIVYLPSTDNHGPSDFSWGKDLQNKFAERYYNISFKEGILEWLKSLDVDSIKDESLELSRRLFIDYLNRVFNLTEIGKMENREINEYVQNILGLRQNDNSYNIGVLTRRINEISDCVNQLERIRKEYCTQVLNEITLQLENDYGNYTIRKDQKFTQSIYTGISIPYKENKNAINILIGFEGRNFIYGVTYAPEFKYLRSEMSEFPNITQYYGEFKKGSDWLFYKNVGIDEGYEKLKELINRMIK